MRSKSGKCLTKRLVAGTRPATTLPPAAISLVANGVLLTSCAPAANRVLWCPGRESGIGVVAGLVPATSRRFGSPVNSRKKRCPIITGGKETIPAVGGTRPVPADIPIQLQLHFFLHAAVAAGGPHHINWFLCRGRSCAGPKTMTKPINDPTDLNLSNIFLGPAQDRPLQCHRGQSIPITGGNL